MKKNEKDFLTLVRNGLHNTNEYVETQISDLAKIAMSHICVPFVYNGAVKAGISIPDDWKNYMTVSFFKNQKNLQVQSVVLKALAEASIPCAVIKGSSVSVNYIEPMARTLGDIDILVREEDYEKAIEILCGSDHENEAAEDHKFHYKFTLSDVPVEIHKFVTEYTDDEYGKLCSEYMKSALDNVVEKSIDEYSFPCLMDTYQAATLLLHTQRHFFENRMPLRMLCDWGMFVARVDINEWNSSIYPFIEKIGLAPLSDALTKTCAVYLGIDCSERIMNSVSDEMAENIIEEFLCGGVVKDKNSGTDKIGVEFSRKKTESRGGVFALLGVINNNARNEFSLARKSELFLPLFWFYIPARYLFRILCGKRDRFSLKSFNETVTRKDYIISNLKLRD